MEETVLTCLHILCDTHRAVTVSGVGYNRVLL